MNDDPIALLERELVKAAGRQTASRGSGRPLGAGRIAGGLATAAVVAVALVIGAGALMLARGHHRVAIPTQTSSGRANSGRQQLIDDIGALRRPQTYVDLHSPAIARLLSTSKNGIEPSRGWGAPDRALIRRASARWGGIFLVPVKPTRGRGEEGLLWATSRFMDCCATAAELKAFGEVNNAGQVKRRGAGRGQAIDRFVAVVPDGVTKVQLGRLLMPVHDNVAAAQASGQPRWCDSRRVLVRPRRPRYPPDRRPGWKVPVPRRLATRP